MNERRAADAAECANGRVHAAGDDFLRALKRVSECLPMGGGFDQRCGGFGDSSTSRSDDEHERRRGAHPTATSVRTLTFQLRETVFDSPEAALQREQIPRKAS